jgi:hypothetical protein
MAPKKTKKSKAPKQLKSKPIQKVMPLTKGSFPVDPCI